MEINSGIKEQYQKIQKIIGKKSIKISLKTNKISTAVKDQITSS